MFNRCNWNVFLCVGHSQVSQQTTLVNSVKWQKQSTLRFDCTTNGNRQITTNFQMKSRKMTLEGLCEQTVARDRNCLYLTTKSLTVTNYNCWSIWECKKYVYLFHVFLTTTVNRWYLNGVYASIIIFDQAKLSNSRSRWPRGLRRWSWPLGYWDCGFESHTRHGCLSLCFCVVLSCLSRGLCDGLIRRPKESYPVS
jgi:hypothetical protein